MKNLFIPILMIILHTVTPTTANPTSQQGKPVHFELVLNKENLSKPILIIYDNGYFEREVQGAGTRVIQPDKKQGNHYFFILPDEHAIQYFSLQVINKYFGSRASEDLMQNYHFEPGDNILISNDLVSGTENKYELNFSGHGNAKYRCQNEFRDRLKLDPHARGPFYTERGNYNSYNQYALTKKLLLDVIEKFQPELSDDSYNLLRLDVICRENKEMIWDIRDAMDMALQHKDIQTYTRISADYRKRVNFDLPPEIPDRIKYLSREYAIFIANKHMCDYLDQYTHINFIGVYFNIITTEPADLKDKAALNLFLSYYRAMRYEYKALIEHALTHTQNKECLAKLRKFAAIKERR